MQEKFPLFSADVGNRLAFLRDKQGVTLETLGDGHPTTAQSWEQGKSPRRAKWGGIAKRLGLSESLIFMGRPDSDADYAFLVNWRNLIEGADEALQERDMRVHAIASFDRIKAQVVRAAHAGDYPTNHGEENPLPIVEEAAASLRRQTRSEGRVLINAPHQPRPAEPTPQACIDHFLTYLKAAEHAPGGIGMAWWKLQKNFPLDEFEPPKK